MAYLPNTEKQRREMLDFLGLKSEAELYADIPLELRAGPLDIPDGLGELGSLRLFSRLASQNTVFGSIFRGAGAYRHFIPAIVGETVSKKRLKTAYTPYQPEVSQGVLQGLFEFQTMICRLTGFDATNASIYDGASAAGEAVAMCRDRKRRRALVSATVNPAIAEVVKTYSWAADGAVDMAPEKNGLTDMGRLEQMLDEGVSSILIQQPNYYGLIEDARGIVALAREKGVKVIVSANPIAMAILQTPAECGADIAVGDGQPLGIPLSFGGPYLGFIAATSEFLRKIPGRIVGETSDAQGRRAFVLTLQAREQHIRRETAGSNLCTSQVLCALAASAYMAAMGPEGMAQAASQSMSKAHYLAAELAKAGFPRRHDAPFFHEFVTECPVEPEALMDRLAQNGILGGLPLPGGGVLWCATEMNSAEEIDRLVALCKEAQK